MHRKLILLLFITTFSSQVQAQDRIPDNITITFSEEPIDQALVKLSDLTPSQLAFNPDILPTKKVTGRYENQSLQNILDDLLGPDYQYKMRGNYVIIQPHEPREKEKKSSVQITGEIRDEDTGQKIEDVSIYEVNKLTATLSDSEGSFDLTSKTYGNRATFMVSKRNYQDTVITVDPAKKGFLNLTLKPLKKDSGYWESLADRLGLMNFFVNKKAKKHTQNIYLEETRLAQLSLVPGISTNGFISGRIKNNISLNLVGGYVHSIEGLEFGGAFNMVRMDVRGVQAAGAANIVGDAYVGTQMAGAVNLNMKHTTGVQMAGAINISFGQLDGLQMAGAYNHAKIVKGSQLSGAINTAKEMTGAQLSGAINIATSSTKGTQIAGAVNLAGDFSGLQMATAANLSGDMDGFQVAGAYNHATGVVNGMQMSGAINYATKLNGIQVGVINVARETEKGLMIGIINITKGGLLAAEIDHNDVTDVSFSFKSGPKHFYTILNSGITSGRDIWSHGIGFGSQIALNEVFFTGLELTSNTLLQTNEWYKNPLYDHRFSLSLGYCLTDRIAFLGGPVLHYAHYNMGSEQAALLYEKVGKKPFSENGANQKWWIGYRVALRL